MPRGLKGFQIGNTFSHPSRFCRQGHDKDSVGRGPQGRCRKCDSIRASAWNKAHPKIMTPRRRNSAWKKMGMVNANGTSFTSIDYDRQYQIQQGKCLGCDIHQLALSGRLHADHDHVTGVFRFLLCMNCNRALGHAQDNPTILRRLADLLEGK
jgi:hypothetical protein